MTAHLIASAPTQEALVKLIAKYFYGSTIRIEGAKVFNAKGWLRHYQVRQVKGRYRFERLPEDREWPEIAPPVQAQEPPDPDDRQFQQPPPDPEEGREIV